MKARPLLRRTDYRYFWHPDEPHIWKVRRDKSYYAYPNAADRERYGEALDWKLDQSSYIADMAAWLIGERWHECKFPTLVRRFPEMKGRR